MNNHYVSELENTLFLGVDIGTVSCKTVLMKVEQLPDGDFKYKILEVNESPMDEATDRSRIFNTEKTIEILQAIIEKTTTGYVGSIYISFTIHDNTLKSKINRVCNPFAKHERMIIQKDVDLALELAGNAYIEKSREYIHIMPRAFYVDDKPMCVNPVGLSGTSLDAEVLLVSVQKESIQQIVHCSNTVGYPCNFICATPFATGEAVLTKKEREEGALVIDIGAGITSATLFEKNMPKAITILPLGGFDITQDISQVLHIPYKYAEQIKHKYGVVDREYLTMYEKSLRIEINQKIIEIQIDEIYKIVLARTAEIIGLLKQQLYTSNNPFPYPIIVTGGSARILGLKQLVERVFKNTTRIAQPWNWGGPNEIYRDPKFSSVIGVCIAGVQHHVANGWSSVTEQEQKFGDNTHLKKSFKRIYSNVSDKFRNFFSLGDIE